MVNQYHEMIFYFGGSGCADFIGNHHLEKLFLFNIWESTKLLSLQTYPQKLAFIDLPVNHFTVYDVLGNFLTIRNMILE